MPDDADLAARIAADLGRVQWPAAEEIRRTGRRRTRRSVLAATLSVLLLFSGVWVAAMRPFQAPPAQTATGFAAQAQPQAQPQPVPTTIGPTDPAWIPPEALLTPEDVGQGLIASQVSVDQDRPVGDWMFTLAPCREFLTLRTYEGVYQFRRQQTLQFPPKIPDQPETGMAVVHQTVMRLPGDAARQLMSDAVTVNEVCPKYVSKGTLSAADAARGDKVVKQMPVQTTHAWQLLDRGFAGDESLLFEHRMSASTGVRSADLGASAVVVLRVGDLVATVEQVDGESVASTRKLATRAARWLCTAATPPC
ncbi:hypothetical protein [Asanoa iriomotensis]|uniref:Uncharacterized protein n=1 Tax=Asanoa iriomotensis TaxID=234613 RepID=A0ABQ4CC61_9ACTN|nr:hypothetical protein [Asanoa iriomotensis]GIF60352.1 hypothetical protein Air01nite_64470 [Asanoa iriomotensis]